MIMMSQWQGVHVAVNEKSLCVFWLLSHVKRLQAAYGTFVLHRFQAVYVYAAINVMPEGGGGTRDDVGTL